MREVVQNGMSVVLNNIMFVLKKWLGTIQRWANFSNNLRAFCKGSITLNVAFLKPL